MYVSKRRHFILDSYAIAIMDDYSSPFIHIDGIVADQSSCKMRNWTCLNFRPEFFIILEDDKGSST